jgi:hypothetical protein
LVSSRIDFVTSKSWSDSSFIFSSFMVGSLSKFFLVKRGRNILLCGLRSILLMSWVV